VIVRRHGHRAVVAHFAEPVLDDVQHLLPVHGVGHGDPYVPVLEELAQAWLLAGKVHLQHVVAGADVHGNVKVALFLILLVQGIVLHPDAPALAVNLTTQDPHVEHVAALVQAMGDRVQVGQLLAFRVDLPVVRVALHHEQLLRKGVRRHPRIGRRAVGVQIPRVAVHIVGAPGVKPFLLDQRCQGVLVRRLFHVKLRHVVVGAERLEPVPGHGVAEQGVRVRKEHVDRIVVRRGELRQDLLGARAQLGGQDRLDVLVLDVVVVEPLEGHAGERGPV